MSFDIPIRIDDAAAKAAVARVTGELDRLERAGKRAGELVSKGLADGSIKAEQAAEATKKLTRELAAAERQAENAGHAARAFADQVRAATAADFGKLGGQIDGLTGKFTTLAGALGVSMGVRSVIELGDAYTSLGNRINQVTTSEAERERVMTRTFQIAQASRSEWNATGELFVRLTNATKEMGLSQGHVLRLTETMSKAFAQSGASSAEASAGMLQLSQALASGKLQGDEFRSLAEAMPSLLDLFAQKLGVTRGELKGLASQGKITSDVIIGAFDDAGASIDRSFAKSMPTFSQSLTTIKNQMEKTFGPLLNELMPKLGEYLQGIADRITGIVNLIERAASQLDKIPGGGTAKGYAGKAYSMLDNVGSFNPYTSISAGVDYANDSAAEIRGAQFWQQYAATFESEAQMFQKLIELSQNERRLVAETPKEWAGNEAQQMQHLLEVTHNLSTGFDRLQTSIRSVADAERDWSGGLAGFRHDLDDLGQRLGIAFAPKLFDPWTQKLAETTKHTQRHVKAMADAWKDTFVSPTLVEIDLLIAKMKQFVGAEKEAADYWKGVFAGAPRLEMPSEGITRDDIEKFKNAGIARGPFPVADVYTTGGGLASGLSEALGASNDNSEAINAKQQRLAAINAKATADYRRQLEEVAKVWEKIGAHIRTVSDSFVDFLADGKQSFSEFTRHVLKELTKIILKELLAAAIAAALPGGGGKFASVFKTGATQDFEGMYDSAPGYVPRAASGFDGVVSSGPRSGDRNLFQAMVNAGERITITPANDERVRGGPKTPINVYLAEGDESAQEDFVIRVIRRNPAHVRAAVTGR